MSVAYLLESSATTKDGERRAPIISPTAGQTGNNLRDDDNDGDRAESTLPTVLLPRSPSSAAAATPVCPAGNPSGNKASDALNRGSGAGPDSTPTSTRSAHKPAVLSLSLRSLEIDTAVPDMPPTAAPAGGNETEQAAAPSAASATPVTHTSAVKAVPYNTPTRTTEPAALSVPMLQLPIKPIKDEVTPVKTLYSRLFHEAQQREQRQTQAQRRQRAAQQAEERQRCTFHPRGADAFAVSPSGKQKRTSVSGDCKGQTPKRASSNSAATPPHAASPSSTSKAAAANLMNRSTASAAEEETAACERLYHNAEQSERRARRLQQLREAQEEEFRSICTFRPCVTPTKAGRQRSMSRSENATALAAPTAESPGKESTGAAATSPRNAARSWEHFLADQEERQAIHERRLADLKKRVAEQEHAALYTGVPRSKASEHLKKYLEKKKGYKGPIEGWSERFDHYMKVKQEAEAAAAPARAGGSRSRARSGSSGAAPRSASIFHRLYHDSDEREAMRELIRMMREQQEQTAFFKPNAGSNGAAAGGSPRTPRQSHSPVQHDADAALETAAAVAVAAGGQEEADDVALQQQHGSSKTIFDTLYAEKEKLQRRRELRHVQAQNTAEVYSFRPHVSSHSRELAKEVARMKASGQHVETVRERRARLAAEAQAEKAAREAQIHFRYDSFARRQAERDRRREDELLQLLLHERSEDVEACRFRPAISHVTEAIVEGNKNYAQLIDDPSVVHELVARQGGGGPSSASAARSVPHDSGAQRASARKGSSSQPTVGERALSSSSAPARRAGLTPVQALAAGAEDLHERSHDAVTESQMQDAFSAPYHTHSMASSSSGSSGGSARQELEWAEQQEGKPSSPSMANANVAERSDGSAFVHREAEKTQANGDSLGTVHIAGAASSTYLRQLESELQDALKEWSQCI